MERCNSLDSKSDIEKIPGLLSKEAAKSGSGRRRGRGRGRGRGRNQSADASTSASTSTNVSASTSASDSKDEQRASSSRRTVHGYGALMFDNYMKKKEKETDKEAKRRKELERSILPDAPPRKRARKVSPERVPCRLVPGTPGAPSSPILELGDHVIKVEVVSEEVANDPEESATSQVSDHPEESATSQVSDHPEEYAPSLLCDWTTGDLKQHGLMAALSTSYASMPAPHQRPPSSPPLSSQQISGFADESANDWLMEQLSGDEEAEEEEALDLGLEGWDFAEEAPAFVDDIDPTLQDWLTHEDKDADRLMRNLLPTDNTTFDWYNSADSFLGKREEFRGQSGPTFTVPADARPIDIFYRFFDNEIFELLVTETNRQINNLTRPLQRHSRCNSMKGTNKEEMVVFIAILLFQGLLPLPVERYYWKFNGFLSLPYFKQLMSYSRFTMLKRFMHFTDNSALTQDVDDSKLKKLGPLLDLLNSRFSELYLPSRDIAIDESLLKWQGPLSFAQKISTKSAKVGIKSYELCESSTGYLWKFIIYTGKGASHGKTQRHADSDRQDVDTDRQDADIDQQYGDMERTATAQIVIDLVKPLLNRGHTLTMDSFYNSPLLARYLKNNGTDCLGTLRVNREFVPESIKGMSNAELRRGEFVQSYCRDLSILLWRDNRVVAMLSTFHGGQIGGKEKFGHYRYKPQAVLDYNQTMGGVDKKDQLLSSHPIERTRNLVWYKKLFRRLLNVTILNSYIIYKRFHPTMTQREFRLRLANDMVASVKPPLVQTIQDVDVVRVIQSTKRSRPILKGNHFIAPGSSKYKRCVWCKKSRTNYQCEECSVSLCLNICFREYHTKT